MPFQLVYKATIGGKASAEVIVVNGSTICMPVGAALEFKIKNTSGKAGLWTWAGVHCAVAAVGQFTGRVTFAAVSASTFLPATITATPTAGGVAQSVRVLVFSVTAQCVPHDNFGGRAADKLGVCEIVKLTATLLPANLNLATYGLSLTWKIVGLAAAYKTTGVLLTAKDVDAAGNIVPAVALTGSALFVAPWKPHTPNVASASEAKTDITLTLQIDGGAVAAIQVAKKVYGVVTPHAHMVPVPNKPLHHYHFNGAKAEVTVATPGVAGAMEYPSAGFHGEIFLTPQNVSFQRIRWSEGVGKMALWGACLANPDEEGAQHGDTHYQNAVHGTVTATGTVRNYVVQSDNVHSTAGILMADFIAQHSQKGATVVGGKTWPIEWKYTYKTHGNNWGTEFVVFQKAFHTFEVRGNGESTCLKRCATKNCTDCMTAVVGTVGAAHCWPD